MFSPVRYCQSASCLGPRAKLMYCQLSNARVADIAQSPVFCILITFLSLFLGSWPHIWVSSFVARFLRLSYVVGWLIWMGNLHPSLKESSLWQRERCPQESLHLIISVWQRKKHTHTQSSQAKMHWTEEYKLLRNGLEREDKDETKEKELWSHGLLSELGQQQRFLGFFFPATAK